MVNPTPDTSGLARATAERTQRTYQQVTRALKAMVRAGEPVTFAELARRAGVSARYIQTHPELGPKVRSLQAAPRRAPLHAATFDQDNVVAALRHHIRQLEQQHTNEVNSLRAELTKANDTIARLTARLIQHEQAHP